MGRGLLEVELSSEITLTLASGFTIPCGKVVTEQSDRSPSRRSKSFTLISTHGPLTHWGKFLETVEPIPSWPDPPRPKEYTRPCLVAANVWQRPADTWVIQLPINSNTFRGSISFVFFEWPIYYKRIKKCYKVHRIFQNDHTLPNWPYIPAPNVNKPPLSVRTAECSSPKLMKAIVWSFNDVCKVGKERFLWSFSPSWPNSFLPKSNNLTRVNITHQYHVPS